MCQNNICISSKIEKVILVQSWFLPGNISYLTAFFTEVCDCDVIVVLLLYTHALH